MLEADLARFPARAGVYVKHLTTGEEAAVNADDAFSSASVIKLTIMVRAFQLVDQRKLNLEERVAIHRADLRDGTGVLQFHDLGQTPTIKDLITEMVITSDNTATDMMVMKIGGVDSLNAWLKASGFSHLSMVARGHVYRRKLLALVNPEFETLTAEETTGLQYAMQDNPLFELYAPLFTAERAKWVAMVRDPVNRRIIANGRNTLSVQNHDYWLGDMNPRETGRLLEAIERGTMTSAASTATMRTIMSRQQLGVRRIPHFLDVPVSHKTGDSPVIANDVGMVYARRGTIIVAFFANGITGPLAETEDMLGHTARRIVDYFDAQMAERAQPGALASLPIPADVPALRKLVGEYDRGGRVVLVIEDSGKLVLLDTARATLSRTTVSPAELQRLRLTKLRVGPADGANQLKVTPVRRIADIRREALLASPPTEKPPARASDLVELITLDPTIKLEIRYATTNNFVGAKFYDEARAFMQRPAADAVVRAHKALRAYGYGLLIHDAYRPWYVTRMFWDAMPTDKRWLVANPADGSKHNRGAAVDLTLYDLKTGQPVDMPSTYDESTGRAHADYPGGTARERWTRALLRKAMVDEGFVINSLEWWHFDYASWRDYAIGNITFDKVSR